MRLLLRRGSIALLVTVATFAVNGCETGGKEGDRCNALVEKDECNSGLHCQQVTCDRTYCCPTDRSSTDPNCNGDGCPSDDAGDEAGDAGLEAAADAGDDAADAADQ